ncbi:AAA family ATPase [Brevibacterium album]|uniref:AAA family ATPase n=1 Tax=Brevibacterium album TaxID=417948 RepID=UPI0009FD4E76|nr:AAA family ATPase [Brevibacterium album]
MAASNHPPVRRISADGVLGEFSYDFKFTNNSGNNSRMKVLYAENGRGKTNLLNAIAALLAGTPDDLQDLIEVPISRLAIEFENGGYIEMLRKESTVGSFEMRISPSEEQSEGGISVYVDASDFPGRLYRRIWEEKKEYVKFRSELERLSLAPVYIGDDRISTTFEEKAEYGRAGSARAANNRANKRTVDPVAQLIERVEGALTRSAIFGISEKSRGTGVYSKITQATLKGASSVSTNEARESLETELDGLLQDGKPLELYGLLSLGQVEEIRQQISRARRNARPLPVLLQILEPYIDSLKSQIESLRPAYARINTFVTGINKFLDRKTLKFSLQEGVRLEGRDGESIPPASLSSGERHLLSLMSQAVLAAGERRLLLIDEPEISLGIDWQRMLLPELLKCSQEGSVQFIVASHSVQVMNSIPFDQIVQPEEPE